MELHIKAVRSNKSAQHVYYNEAWGGVAGAGSEGSPGTLVIIDLPEPDLKLDYF